MTKKSAKVIKQYLEDHFKNAAFQTEPESNFGKPYLIIRWHCGPDTEEVHIMLEELLQIPYMLSRRGKGA